MEIEEALRAFLLTNTALTFLIGDRILSDDLSDGAALPCVVYTKVSDVKSHTLTGQSELERPVFQFSAYAESKSIARQINNQIKSALCDFQGSLSGIIIQKIELQNESSTRHSMPDSTKYYVDDLEFEINFIRS